MHFAWKVFWLSIKSRDVTVVTRVLYSTFRLFSFIKRFAGSLEVLSLLFKDVTKSFWTGMPGVNPFHWIYTKSHKNVLNKFHLQLLIIPVFFFVTLIVLISSNHKTIVTSALRIHLSPECKAALDLIGGFHLEERGPVSIKVGHRTCLGWKKSFI